jgi:hypothetical protein
MLRKASLLAEFLRFDEGEKLIIEAHRELLKQHRNDRNSIYVFSRLAWADYLLHGIERSKLTGEIKVFPSVYKDSKCDPWDYIKHIQNRVSEALEKQKKRQKIEPLFKPGHYKDDSNTVTFDNSLHPLFLLEGISSSVGLPLRWCSLSFLIEEASKLAELDEMAGMPRFALAIRAANSGSSEALEKVFSRIQVARLPKNEVDSLWDCCIQAIDYWSLRLPKEKNEAQLRIIERLRVFIEVLARLSVRVEPEAAKKIFRKACNLLKQTEFHHFWLFDSLNHLMEYTLQSIPKPQESQQHELLLEALLFPLETEIDLKNFRGWPNPVINFPGKRDLENTALNHRIDKIIDKIAPGSSQATPELLRILPLFENRFLTDAERQKMAENIWGTDPDYQAFPKVGLWTYALLDLPTKNPSEAKQLARRYLFEAKDDDLLSASVFLRDIIYAAQKNHNKELPSESQAIDYFNRLIAWRTKHNDKDALNSFRKIEKQMEKQTGELIGNALAQSIVPALPAQALTKENFQKLYDFYAEVESPAAIVAFLYFAAVDDSFTEKVEKLIRQGLQAQSADKVSNSSFALLKWRELNTSSTADKIDRLIPMLISLIGSNRMTGLPNLLWTANQLYNKKYLSDNDTVSLIEILPVIFDNADYRNISPSSLEAVSISYVRAKCVILARDILNKEPDRDNGELRRILEAAKADPLPEVRFA